MKAHAAVRGMTAGPQREEKGKGRIMSSCRGMVTQLLKISKCYWSQIRTKGVFVLGRNKWSPRNHKGSESRLLKTAGVTLLDSFCCPDYKIHHKKKIGNDA